MRADSFEVESWSTANNQIRYLSLSLGWYVNQKLIDMKYRISVLVTICYFFCRK